MRRLAISVAGICLLAMSAGITPVSAAGATEAKGPVVLAQAEPKKKDETLKQKVKRVWRNWTGYKFAVACPALIPLTHSTCTETGKNRNDARAKCQSANPICSVSDVR